MDTKGMFKKGVNLITLASFLVWNLAAATPEGGSVAQGSAAITQSGSTTTITQTSSKTVINWGSFDTASNEAVQFNQPNSSAIALNRINSGSPTNFNGSLSANGQVWILNPSGVLFGSSAKIDVAGLLATTHNITDANFIGGNYKFDLVPGSENSSVINNGLISAKDSGIVALVAPYVQNNGLIQVSLGTIALASGASFVLDMYGDQLINFGSNVPINNGAVSNAGKIVANGGKVYMTANYASGVLDNMISMSGSIEAKSVSKNHKGEIVLFGGNPHTKKVAGVTKVSGKLDVSSDDGQIGGFIETSGHGVDLGGADIKVGLGGTWLLDPDDISIVAGGSCTNPACSNPYTATGLSTVGASFIQGILSTGGNVTLTATGNISIDTPLAIGGFYLPGNLPGAPVSSQAALTLNAGDSIFLNQQLSNSAPGHHLYLTMNAGQLISTGSIYVNANVLMPNAGGFGGFLTFNAGTAGSVYINTPIIQTGAAPLFNGLQGFGFVFNSPVILQQDVTLSSSNGLNKFNSTVDGPFSLTIGASTGTIDFGGNVGVNTPLTSISVNSAGMRGTGGIRFITTGNQYYNPQVFSFGSNSFTFIGQNPGAVVTLNGGVHTNNSAGFVQVGAPTYATNAVIRSSIFGFNPFPTSSLTVYGTTVLDGATISTSGTQNYKGAVDITGSNAVLNSSGLVLFENTVDGPGSLTTNANNTQFNSVAAGITQFSAFNINNTITLNGGSINQNAVTYNNPVVVTGLNGTMNGAGLIRFNSSLTGAGTLTINDSLGSVEFAGAVVSLGGLNVTGLTTITTPTMQTINDQVYNSPVTLGGHSSIISISGSIDFKNTVESDTFGAWDLFVNAFNQVKFEGNVGSTPLASLNVNAGNGIIINPNILSNPVLSIITTGNQTYNGNIQLTTTYTAPGVVPRDVLQSTGGNITLNGPVSLIYPGGEVSLFLDAANNVYINNTISMDPSPNSPGEGGYLDVTAGNAIYINTPIIDVGSAGDANTPVPILRSLDFHSPVLLQQDLTLISSSWGHVMIHSTIDTDPLAVSEHSLTMIAPTLVDIYGSMGVNRALSSIDIDSAVLRFLNGGSVQYITTGNQTYSQSQFDSLFTAIVLGATDITFTSTGNGLVSIIGGIHSFFFNASMQINGNAYLKGNTFSSPNFYTDGLFFAITITGDTELDNAIINTKLSNQLYQGNVTVTDNGASLTTAAAIIEFGGNVNSVAGNNNAVLNLYTPFGGYTQFDGTVNVGASTDPLLALNGTDPFVFNGSIFNVDNFVFASPIEITSLGGIVNSNTLVTFSNTIDGFASGNAGALTVNGNATINGTVGGVDPLFRLFVSGNTSLGANVTTYGDVEFGGPVTLTNDVTVTDTGTGIIFDSTIDSDATARSLTLNATAGSVSLKGDIGFNAALSALDVFGQNYIEIVSVSHPTLFNIITTGNQSYTSPFFYINVYPALAINFEGAQIKLGAYTNASNPDTSLTITGDLLLEDNGIIGGNSSFFSNITVTGASILGTTPYSGTILINTISRTSGNSSQTYMGPITIFENRVDMGAFSVISGNTGTISYNSTIDGPGKLVTNASGAVNFGNTVGATTALSEMQIFSSVIDITHPTQSTSFTTSGIMVLGNGAATDVLLDTLNSITFNASSLTLFAAMNSYGAVTPLPTAVTVVGQFILPPDGFSAPVGGKYLLPNYTNIKSVDVQGYSVIAENIITSELQNYGAVGIAGDVTFIQLLSGYDITFAGVVNSALSWTANQQKSVVVNAAGNVNFQNGVGTSAIAGAANLINLDVTGAQINLNGAYFGTSGYQNYHSPVVLVGDVNAPGILAGGNVIFENTLDGLFSLAILSDAMVKFDGNVGASAALNLVDVTAQQINFNAALTSVTSTGTQTYTGSGVAPLMTIGADPVFTAPNFLINIPVLINAATTYTSTSGNIDFQQAITGDGVSSLILNPVGGSAIFRSSVGSLANPLGSLTVNGTSIFNQGSAQNVYTNGDQIYLGTSEINNDLSLEALTTGRIVLGSDSAGFFDNPSNSYHLNAVTHNAVYGATGQGITGHVDVGSFTVGGEGGANVSPISKTSVVATGTGDTAFVNWLISPEITNTYYCINGAAGCNPTPPVPPSTPFFNIPPLEIFNIPMPVTCSDTGCNNVEVMIDNLVEAGVVECGGISGCPFGFATAEDTNGKVRILVPGSIVYVGDKIIKDKDACVCVKSLYKNEKSCMGPNEKNKEYKA